MTMRRETQWYTKILGFSSLASSAQTSLDLLSGMPQDMRKGATVTRMVYKLVVRPTAVAQLVEAHYGVVVVSTEAFVAGAMPEADVVSDRPDWMMRGWLYSMADSISDRSQYDTTEMDLRAQRRLPSEDNTLALVFDASTSGFGLEFAVFFRTLMKLR